MRVAQPRVPACSAPFGSEVEHVPQRPDRVHVAPVLARALRRRVIPCRMCDVCCRAVETVQNRCAGRARLLHVRPCSQRASCCALTRFLTARLTTFLFSFAGIVSSLATWTRLVSSARWRRTRLRSLAKRRRQHRERGVEHHNNDEPTNPCEGQRLNDQRRDKHRRHAADGQA